MPTHRINPLISLGIFFLLAIAFHRIYSPFFDPSSTIGHDYSLALPIYLDGYYWYINNGIFTPPWFSPSFCAGQPFFADPQSVFYSPTQFLSFILDPLAASYWSFFGFAVAGFWGMYSFCRQHLDSERSPALLAASLWMFNGFSTHHHLIGHVGFLPVFIAPLIALLLLKHRQHGFSSFTSLLGPTLAGTLIALCLQSGLGSLMIPFALAVWGMACLSIMRKESAQNFYTNSIIAGIIATGLCASKIIAASSLMQAFPRSQYLLPGISHLSDIPTFIARIFFAPEELFYTESVALMINRNVGAGPHEFAFYMTPIPALLIVIGLIAITPKLKSILTSSTWTQKTHTAALIGITFIAFAVLYYSPEWNATLKSLPVISSTSAPWRWLIIFLPLVCCGTCLAANSIFKSKAIRSGLPIALIAALVIFEIICPRGFYEEQSYDAGEIIEAYQKAHTPGFRPEIKRLGTYVDGSGEPVHTGYQNNLIAQSVSQVFCYNPLFGYNLENFELGKLKPGNPLKSTGGHLNLKNPACYVFPEQNACQPGDQFRDTPADQEKAKHLVTYQPWEFEIPTKQKVANSITIITLLVTLCILLGAAATQLRRR